MARSSWVVARGQGVCCTTSALPRRAAGSTKQNPMGNGFTGSPVRRRCRPPVLVKCILVQPEDCPERPRQPALAVDLVQVPQRGVPNARPTHLDPAKTQPQKHEKVARAAAAGAAAAADGHLRSDAVGSDGVSMPTAWRTGWWNRGCQELGGAGGASSKLVAPLRAGRRGPGQLTRLVCRHTNQRAPLDDGSTVGGRGGDTKLHAQQPTGPETRPVTLASAPDASGAHRCAAPTNPSFSRRHIRGICCPPRPHSL